MLLEGDVDNRDGREPELLTPDNGSAFHRAPAGPPPPLGQAEPIPIYADPRVIVAVAAAIAVAIVGLLIAAFLVDDGTSTTTDGLAPAAPVGGDELVGRTAQLTSDSDGSGAAAGGSGVDGTGAAETGDIGTSVLPGGDDQAPTGDQGAIPTPSGAPTTAGPTTAPTTTPTAPTTAPVTTPAPTTAPPTTSAPTTAGPTTAPASTATTVPATTPAPAPGPSGGDGAIQQQILAITNTERAKAGCPALGLDAQLNAAADGHAEDMAANNYFSHTDRNGGEPWDRMTAAGYGWSRMAENIAAGQPSPESVMQTWMNSSGHRANILNCGLRDLGVGYALRGSSPYWVQVFGTR